MKRTFILLLLLGLAASAFARTYVVRPDGAGHFTTIQTAVNAISDGDTIELTNGIFTGFGNRDIDYLGKAIVIRSQSGNADSCIIDCQWRGHGFCFYSGERPSSVLEGVTVGNGEANEGGGIWCHYNSSPTFNNCRIVGNSTEGFHTNGGGVYCYHSSPAFINCTFENNRANHAGGGAYFIDSSPNLINCTFNGNVSADYGGAIHFEHSPSAICASCTLRNNYAGLEGGAVTCSHSSPILTNCVLYGNSALWYGGGVACFDSSSPSFANCTISGDTAQEEGGGGVSCRNSSSPTFTNCAIIGNCADYEGGGVYCEDSSPTFNSTVIAFSSASGISFENSDQSQITYCDLSRNSGGAFRGDIPTGLGPLATTNANGDSCDMYHNIFLDPMFVDTAAGDFHLLAGSPCIDAGDPSLPHDPDSTIADIGAFYYHQSAAEPFAVLLPKIYELHPNWPNPFNSSTMIRYDVPQAGKVSLTIFNLLGQRVATVFDGRQLAGSYTIAWDAANLPSGVYLCRMDAAGFAQTRKLVLVK